MNKVLVVVSLVVITMLGCEHKRERIGHTMRNYQYAPSGGVCAVDAGDCDGGVK